MISAQAAFTGHPAGSLAHTHLWLLPNLTVTSATHLHHRKHLHTHIQGNGHHWLKHIGQWTSLTHTYIGQWASLTHTYIGQWTSLTHTYISQWASLTHTYIGQWASLTQTHRPMYITDSHIHANWHTSLTHTGQWTSLTQLYTHTHTHTHTNKHTYDNRPHFLMLNLCCYKVCLNL